MVLARLRALVALQLQPLALSSPVATLRRRADGLGYGAWGGGCTLAALLARVFRWGASIGYGGLLLVFTVRDLRPPSHKLSARLSVLMLLQGLVLVGLAPLPTAAAPNSNPASGDEETGGLQRLRAVRLVRCLFRSLGLLRDPLAWLLAKSPAAWGNVSYSQYVLQFIAYALWARMGKKGAAPPPEAGRRCTASRGGGVVKNG